VGYSPRVLALGFVALFVVIGLSVFFVAFRGGSKGAAQTNAARKRKIGRPMILGLALVFLVFGAVIPVWVGVYNAGDQAEAAIGGVKLTAAEEHGRQVFKERCATCHMLDDAGAVGLVGPDLDNLRPPSALVLDAIAKGRARGQGQMPALLITGGEAKDVADYVAKVAGR
jgi:mono/diheme cytochrome c family protein